ncbi:MAG: SsrA-binding protein SmpB [Actinomycetaceae bacterium]|nr:SsrA-binding protein SmpB [Actinomycetaceae bacterium]MDY6082397.1 SsrA-binding protein SmpB [Actinomycetaceae bacterium]
MAGSGTGTGHKLTPAQKAKAASDAKQTIARNKKALHDYFIEDRFEAGLSLSGTEVKALRDSRASLTDAWVDIDRGEAWLMDMNIPVYASGSWTNHVPKRKRKLLLHKSEIDELAGGADRKGYTIVPLELYFVRGYVKVEIALARGKQEWDKRETIRRREADREAERAMSVAHKRARSGRL